MTINYNRIQRRISELRQLKYTMEQCDKTGLCAVCGIGQRYLIREGVFSMTCERRQCKRSWLLFEPYRCEFCQSLDFERLEMQWDDQGRKLYHCRGCDKTYAIHRRVVFETMADVEQEIESGGDDEPDPEV